jgi:hypothetical protein
MIIVSGLLLSNWVGLVVRLFEVEEFNLWTKKIFGFEDVLTYRTLNAITIVKIDQIRFSLRTSIAEMIVELIYYDQSTFLNFRIPVINCWPRWRVILRFRHHNIIVSFHHTNYTRDRFIFWRIISDIMSYSDISKKLKSCYLWCLNHLNYGRLR